MVQKREEKPEPDRIVTGKDDSTFKSQISEARKKVTEEIGVGVTRTGMLNWEKHGGRGHHGVARGCKHV